MDRIGDIISPVHNFCLQNAAAIMLIILNPVESIFVNAIYTPFFVSASRLTTDPRILENGVERGSRQIEARIIILIVVLVECQPSNYTEGLCISLKAVPVILFFYRLT